MFLSKHHLRDLERTEGDAGCEKGRGETPELRRECQATDMMGQFLSVIPWCARSVCGR
jgi:hypothetical protein